MRTVEDVLEDAVDRLDMIAAKARRRLVADMIAAGFSRAQIRAGIAQLEDMIERLNDEALAELVKVERLH